VGRVLFFWINFLALIWGKPHMHQLSTAFERTNKMNIAFFNHFFCVDANLKASITVHRLLYYESSEGGNRKYISLHG
jgi:hypothetical protein